MSAKVPVLELKNVTKQFGSFIAVADASVRVYKGEIVGFVGANGAGKTTTINMLLGFTSPTKGLVKAFTEKVTPQTAHIAHQRIGYASGDMQLPQRLTGKQYLAFVMGQMPRDYSAQYKLLVRRFQPQLDKKIHELSRGNKQKIALIAAFITDPDVIVLDEPTSGLDPVMREEFLDLAREYKHKGKTVFMSSHYLQEVVNVCDRVILMRHGKIIKDVATDELLSASGKYVSITTGYKHTKAPKGAEHVSEETTADGKHELTFMWNGEMAPLQAWLASVKLLTDVSVSDHDVEEAFSSLYDDEERTL